MSTKFRCKALIKITKNGKVNEIVSDFETWFLLNK